MSSFCSLPIRQCLGSFIGSNYHPNMKPAESSAETPPLRWWRSHPHLRMEVHSQGHLEASVRFEIVLQQVFELVVGERAGYRRDGLVPVMHASPLQPHGTPAVCPHIYCFYLPTSASLPVLLKSSPSQHGRIVFSPS